jgi:hypothetical protein
MDIAWGIFAVHTIYTAHIGLLALLAGANTRLLTIENQLVSIYNPYDQ